MNNPVLKKLIECSKRTGAMPVGLLFTAWLGDMHALAARFSGLGIGPDLPPRRILPDGGAKAAFDLPVAFVDPARATSGSAWAVIA